MQETKATKEYWAAVQAAREGMDSLDIAAQNTSIVPLIGDALGVASDVKQYVKGEKELTPINAVLSAVGALPFVPSPSQVRKIVGRPEEKQAKIYEEKEAEITKGDKNYTLSLADMVKLEEASGVWRGADGVLRTNYSARNSNVDIEYQTVNANVGNYAGTYPYVSSTRSKVGYDYPGKGIREADVTDFINNLPEIPGVDYKAMKLAASEDTGMGGGWYNPVTNQISLNSASTEKATKQLMLHEVGHGVQKAHNLHGGDDPINFMRPADKKNDPKYAGLVDDYKVATKLYERSPGEIDAETASVFDTYVRRNATDSKSMVLTQDAYVRSLLQEQGIFIDDNVPAQIFGAVIVPERARRNK